MKLRPGRTVYGGMVELPDLPPQTFWPLGCNVALLPVPLRQTESGLVFPDGTNAHGMGADFEQTSQCLVVATGPDCKWVQRGDLVLMLSTTTVWKVRHNPRGAILFMVGEPFIVGIIDRVDGSQPQLKSSVEMGLKPTEMSL